MRRVLVCLAVIVPSLASADTLKLFAELHGGGMYGTGTSGDQKDSAFFAASPRASYGALVGGEFLIFDAWIQHHQYTDGDHLSTWTQFGLGIHEEVELGDAAQQKAHRGAYLELSAGLWFGLGTGAQVMPPLDNAQITDKAFLGEGRLGFGTHLDDVFDLGVEIPVSYGWFFKSGNGATANNLSDQYRGIEGEALVVLRGNLRLL
ncbi:MAG TPA: hypothetical protein VLX92_01140 [Kofleriaceae bacterium]|nr:hypothetical protein [Kofleriaceae bacterium]